MSRQREHQGNVINLHGVLTNNRSISREGEHTSDVYNQSKVLTSEVTMTTFQKTTQYFQTFL